LKKKILHITPHLGGGVGKAVSTLINNDKEYCHDVICLEKPINYKFYHIIKKKNKIIITKNISIIKNFCVGRLVFTAQRETQFLDLLKELVKLVGTLYPLTLRDMVKWVVQLYLLTLIKTQNL
jgi:hypothetical protein